MEGKEISPALPSFMSTSSPGFWQVPFCSANAAGMFSKIFPVSDAWSRIKYAPKLLNFDCRATESTQFDTIRPSAWREGWESWALSWRSNLHANWFGRTRGIQLIKDLLVGGKAASPNVLFNKFRLSSVDGCCCRSCFVIHKAIGDYRLHLNFQL